MSTRACRSARTTPRATLSSSSGTSPNSRSTDSDNLSWQRSQGQSQRGEGDHHQQDGCRDHCAPTSTRIVVATPRAQPSANGVNHSASGSIWVTSAISNPVKITEVIAGGIAPSRNIRAPRDQNSDPCQQPGTGHQLHQCWPHHRWTSGVTLIWSCALVRTAAPGLGGLPKLILKIQHCCRRSGSLAARMRTAKSPAFRALPMATVATGTRRHLDD